jgi:hypothetical protein
MTSQRRGFVFPATIFVVLFLSILILQFFWISRHSRIQAHRFAMSEVNRKLAESAMEEAYKVFSHALEQSLPIRGHILERNPTSQELPLSRVRELAQDLVPGYSSSVRAWFRLVDFRECNAAGKTFYGQEALGTIELKVETRLFQGNKTHSLCRFLRHHDLKIATLATQEHDEARTQYAGGFLLDYLLFIRDGVQEFTETSGLSLNPPPEIQVRFTQPAEEIIGRIFLGATGLLIAGSGGERRIPFLNVSEEKAEAMPILPPRQVTIDLNDCVTLFPHLKNIDIKDPQGNKIPWEDLLSGLTGDFSLSHRPIWRKEYSGFEGEVEKANRNGAARAEQLRFPTTSNPGGNTNPGIEVLGDLSPTMVGKALVGHTRQRFLHHSSFILNWNSAQNAGMIPAAERKKAKAEGIFVSVLPAPEGVSGATKDFFEGLGLISQAKPDLDILSRLNRDYSPESGQDGSINPNHLVREPRLLGFKTGPTVREDPRHQDLRPFLSYSLWYRDVPCPSDLEKFGFLEEQPDHTLLRLKGIVWVLNDVVELGRSDKPCRYEGQGVIVAPGFRLSGALLKANPSSQLVLYAWNGAIQIETTAPIQAALMAISPKNHGTVQANAPLNLHGSLAVDHLGTQHWAPGQHTISYDPALKPVEDIFMITISPLLTFQRFTETEADGG